MNTLLYRINAILVQFLQRKKSNNHNRLIFKHLPFNQKNMQIISWKEINVPSRKIQGNQYSISFFCGWSSRKRMYNMVSPIPITRCLVIIFKVPWFVVLCISYDAIFWFTISPQISAHSFCELPAVAGNRSRL